jgi:hypothetical protein
MGGVIAIIGQVVVGGNIASDLNIGIIFVLSDSRDAELSFVITGGAIIDCAHWTTFLDPLLGKFFF